MPRGTKLPAVPSRYAGEGRWRIGHPEGDDVIGRCLDVELVAAHPADELSETQREESAAFVAGHLLDSNAAVAPAEAIVGGLFGIGSGFGEAGMLETRFGASRNVRAVGFELPVAVRR